MIPAWQDYLSSSTHPLKRNLFFLLHLPLVYPSYYTSLHIHPHQPQQVSHPLLNQVLQEIKALPRKLSDVKNLLISHYCL